MSRQLDILALEPFYGGPRKAMLETITRFSRHRWTIFHLPPRRIERRLAAAAHWFAEQIARQASGQVDLLFTSEAINLADLLRNLPELTLRPRVVYFHDNQLPPEGMRAESPLHLVNLTTANSATEIWFNSMFHLRSFLQRATSLVQCHPELLARNPLPDLTGKAQLMPPPVDFGLEEESTPGLQRLPKLLIVNGREMDVDFFNDGLGVLERRGEHVELLTIGPVPGLEAYCPCRQIPENDEAAQLLAMRQSGVIIGTRQNVTSDYLAIRALHAGCWPVFPDSGFYPESLPKSMHSCCIYEPGAADRLGTLVQNSWLMDRPLHYERDLDKILSRHNAIEACHNMDDRLEKIAHTT